MTTQTFKYRFRTLYATAATFAAENPVLLEGEPAYESDTGREKIGDGVTAWNSLAYKSSQGGTLGDLADVDIAAKQGKSVLYYDSAAGKWKGDQYQTLDEIVNGGNF